MNKKVILLTSLLAISSLTGCGKNKPSSSMEPSSKAPQDNGVPTEMMIPEADDNKETVTPEAVYPDELLMNHRVASLLVGEEYELRAIDQFNYTPELVFKSADETIATVSEKGVITGVNEGETEIEVSDKNNPDFKTTISVIVSPAITESEAVALAEYFMTVDEEGLNKIVDYNMYEKTIYKNGEMVSYDRYDERMSVSKPDAYFRIWETDCEIRVKDGSKNFTNYDWVFYTNPFYDTYVYHQVGDVKTYYPVATQSYMGKDRTEPLLAILDNLFVSGSGVFENPFKNALLSGFTDMVGSGYSNVSDEYYGSLGDGQMIYGCTVSFDSTTADQDDESRYGIPYGTPTPATQAMRYTIVDERVVALAVHLEEEYTIGDDQYVEVYEIDHTFFDFEEDDLFVPNKKDYTLVDYLFAI